MLPVFVVVHPSPISSISACLMGNRGASWGVSDQRQVIMERPVDQSLRKFIRESLVEPSDHSLLQGYHEGSEEAAAQIYDRYACRLVALVRARCSADLARRLDVEDIVQSAFRSFFRVASTGVYEVPDGKDLWCLLLTITLNKIRAQGVFHRAAKRDVRLTTQLSAHETSGTVPSRKDAATDTTLRHALEESLEALPPQQRTLVELRIHGHEIAEIAQHVGRSKRTVERGLQQAVATLKTLFEGS
jgi:RNA polymerase sigma-70 factor (ECF subfamily)